MEEMMPGMVASNAVSIHTELDGGKPTDSHML